MHCNFANQNNKETRKNNRDGTNLKELKSFSPGIVIFNSLGVTKCFKNWIRLHRVSRYKSFLEWYELKQY